MSCLTDTPFHDIIKVMETQHELMSHNQIVKNTEQLLKYNVELPKKTNKMKLTGEFEMRDIRGKRIVGYEAACALKMMGFDWQCTGYYHCDDYGCEEEYVNEDFRYECVGWRGLYRNSYSVYCAAAPTLFQAKLWLGLLKVRNILKRLKR